MKILVEPLKNNFSLCSLYLGGKYFFFFFSLNLFLGGLIAFFVDNFICDDGAESVAELIEETTSLRSLDLSSKKSVEGRGQAERGDNT